MAFPVFANAQDRPEDWEARLEQARALNDIMPVEQQFEQALAESLLDIPPEHKAETADLIRERVDLEDLQAISIEAMAELFTVEEMRAMKVYFGSPEAASIARKMPVYERAIEAAIRRTLQPKDETSEPSEEIAAPE